MFDQPGAGPRAYRRYGNIRAAIDRLTEFPCLYPVGDYLGRREMSREGHRVIYCVSPDTGSNATAGDAGAASVWARAVARPFLTKLTGPG